MDKTEIQYMVIYERCTRVEQTLRQTANLTYSYLTILTLAKQIV